MLAQEEARLLNHSFIGTEHILLGLMHEGEGVAAEALATLGISLEGVREKVEETIGMSGSAPMDPVPFTPRAKKVLELSLREALQMGHRYIGTEHLLLGLVPEGEGVAATVLVSLGAELPRVRQVVITLISGGQEPYGGGQVNELDTTTTDRSAAALEPRCPRCRANVTDGTRFRTIAVHPRRRGRRSDIDRCRVLRAMQDHSAHVRDRGSELGTGSLFIVGAWLSAVHRWRNRRDVRISLSAKRTGRRAGLPRGQEAS